MDNFAVIELMYLDWVNNFLTPPKFAAYYDITEKQALDIIGWGRNI